MSHHKYEEEIMRSRGLPELVVILIIIVVFAIVFLVIPYWHIFKKAGFSPALCLLMLIPLINVAMLYYLAFAEWPSLKQFQK
jgi:hypothetical protein